MRFDRASGVLLHPTSLPGPHGWQVMDSAGAVLAAPPRARGVRLVLPPVPRGAALGTRNCSRSSPLSTARAPSVSTSVWYSPSVITQPIATS